MNLLLGAGFLSEYIVDSTWASKSWSVNRSGSVAKKGEREERLSVDILEESSVRELEFLMSTFKGYVFYLLPPSSFAGRPVKSALSPLFKVLKKGTVRGVIVVSSTGVFSEAEGETVNNTSIASGLSGRVKCLLEIENTWLSSPFKVVVARLGGLYGKNRIIGRRLLLSGEDLPGVGDEYLNLIHGLDAARALLELTKPRFSGKTFVVTDAHPVERRSYYSYLAGKLNVESPNFNGCFRGSYKCDSRNTWKDLKISPKFLNYRLGLDNLIE